MALARGPSGFQSARLMMTLTSGAWHSALAIDVPSESRASGRGRGASARRPSRCAGRCRGPRARAAAPGPAARGATRIILISPQAAHATSGSDRSCAVLVGAHDPGRVQLIELQAPEHLFETRLGVAAAGLPLAFAEAPH